MLKLRNPVASSADGTRTPLWRDLSYAVGDALATRCCFAVYLVLLLSRVPPERVARGWFRR